MKAHSPLASNYFFKTTFLCPYFVHFCFSKKTSLHMRPHAHVCFSSLLSPLSDQFPFFPYVSSYLITYTVIVDDADSLLSLPLTCSLPLTVYSCTSYSFCYSGFGVSTWCATHSTFPPLVPFFLFLAIVDKVDIVRQSLSVCISGRSFFSRNEKKVDCVVPQVINSPNSDRLHKPQHKSFSRQPTRPTVVHVYVSDSNREQEREKSLFT